MPRLLLCLLPLLLACGGAAAGDQTIAIGFLGHATAPVTPLSPLDVVAPDEGVAGARLAIADNNTTGAFTRQHFTLDERVAGIGGDPAAAMEALAAEGVRFVVADLTADELLAVADRPEAQNAVIFNIRAPDDALRNAECRPNLLHIIPSRAMLADALAQYLMWKRWDRWFLVVGRHAEDRLYAEAIHRAADRFGAAIVAEKAWTFQPGEGRADTGHVSLQTEVPGFTQTDSDYDVLVVADEAGEFGEILPGRTFLPRPVAGTQGLVATAWSPVHQQWGGMQLQDRFRAAYGRPMTVRDYTAWLAVRAIGEAATRTGSSDPETMAAYLRGPDFVLAGFKGVGLTFRDWDGQLRQPVLIAGPRVLVSVSPQAGYLHEASVLDTLGTDRPNTECRR